MALAEFLGELIVQLIVGLSWPAAILLLAFWFREPLKRLLRSVRSVKYGQFEVELAGVVDNLLEANEVALDVPLPEIESEDARDAIIAYWRLAREHILELAEENGIGLTQYQRRSTRRVAEVLADNEIIGEESVEAIRGLQRIRNNVAHNIGELPDDEFSREYRRAVALLLAALTLGSSD